MNLTKQEQIDKCVELLMPEAIEMVKMIDEKPLTTQNHYGDWMSALSMFGDQPTVQQVLVLACIKAGGNEQGIKDGYRMATGKGLM